jgi:hypothetical protein
MLENARYIIGDAILPWIGFHGSIKNIGHAFQEVNHENSVQTVNAVSNHILSCERDTEGSRPIVVVIRQPPAGKGNNSKIGMETKVLAHATGNKDLYRAPETGATTCFSALWASIQEGLEHISDAVCRIDPVDMVETWRRALGHRASSPDSSPLCAPLASRAPPSVAFIERSSPGRQILNKKAIVKAMVDKGWTVRSVRLECLSFDEQFECMQNVTTLIGYHGAGLSWARALPEHAAWIQVLGLPCSPRSGPYYRSFDFGRGKYAVLHSALPVIGTERNQTRANLKCRKEELNKLGDRPRKMNAILDVSEVIRTVEMMDPMLMPSDKLKAICGADTERRTLSESPATARKRPSLGVGSSPLSRCTCQI